MEHVIVIILAIISLIISIVTIVNVKEQKKIYRNIIEKYDNLNSKNIDEFTSKKNK